MTLPKKRSPFEQTFVIGYANDINVSYVPTTESYDEGGYEPEWAKVDQGADKIIEDEAVALLKNLQLKSPLTFSNFFI